jgi:hypothetical protein
MKFKPTYANVVSTVALVLAVSGGAAFAATALPRHSVGTRQLKDDAVTGAKVRDGSLRSRDFAVGSIPSGAPGSPGPSGAPGAPGSPGSPGASGAPGPSFAHTERFGLVGLSCHDQSTTVASYDFTPTVDTGLLAGYDFDWDGIGVQGQADASFDFSVLVGPIDAGGGAGGGGMQLTNENAPTTEVRHLSSWGVTQSSVGGELTLNAGTHYLIELLASPTTNADVCTSAQIERGELTIQFAGLTP